MLKIISWTVFPKLKGVGISASGVQFPIIKLILSFSLISSIVIINNNSCYIDKSFGRETNNLLNPVEYCCFLKPPLVVAYPDLFVVC